MLSLLINCKFYRLDSIGSLNFQSILFGTIIGNRMILFNRFRVTRKFIRTICGTWRQLLNAFVHCFVNADQIWTDENVLDFVTDATLIHMWLYLTPLFTFTLLEMFVNDEFKQIQKWTLLHAGLIKWRAVYCYRNNADKLVIKTHELNWNTFLSKNPIYFWFTCTFVVRRCMNDTDVKMNLTICCDKCCAL